MKRLGLLLVLGLFACGSDKAVVVPDAVVAPDAPIVVRPDGAVPDAPVLPDATVADAIPPIDAPAPPIDAVVLDASVADAAMADAPVVDASVPDASIPDARTPDASIPDAKIPDASRPDAQTGCVAATTTTSSHADFSSVNLTAAATTDYVLLDGYNLHGTISSATLPAGATVASATMAANDGAAQFHAVVTKTGNSFTYSVGLPAGHYQLQGSIAFTFGASNADGTLLHFGHDTIDVCGDATRDLVLADLGPLQKATVTVSNTAQLGAPSGPTGFVTTAAFVDADFTVLAYGVSTPGASSTSVTLPMKTLTPLATVLDAGSFSGTLASGFATIVQLPEMAAATAYNLALPSLVKLSGQISDPAGQLSPARIIFAGPPVIYSPSALSYVHVLPTGRAGTVLGGMVEGFIANIYTFAPSYKTFARAGVTAGVYGEFAVQVGAGGDPVTAGDNTVAYLELPALENVSYAARGADFTQSFTVPNLGAEKVTLTGTVSDAHGHRLANASITVRGTALASASLAGDAFHAQVTADANGAFKLNVVKGVYNLTVDR